MACMPDLGAVALAARTEARSYTRDPTYQILHQGSQH